MPGLHDIDVSGFIKEQLPSFVQDNGSQQFQAFLEAYYQWLELVQIDVTRDVSELFYKDQILFGTRSQAQATIFAVKKLDENNSRIWVRYISEKKFFTNETLYTEGLTQIRELFSSKVSAKTRFCFLKKILGIRS